MPEDDPPNEPPPPDGGPGIRTSTRKPTSPTDREKENYAKVAYKAYVHALEDDDPVPPFRKKVWRAVVDAVLKAASEPPPPDGGPGVKGR